MFFHRLKDGKILNQDAVIDAYDGLVIVQLFSWIDGRPTTVHRMNKRTLYGKNFALYPNQEEMQAAYDKERFVKGGTP